MNWYLGCWKKYATFSGRARRKEYWLFVLFNFIATLVAAFVDGFLGTSTFSGLYPLAAFIPSLAVGVRRLHDTDRSGWWWLINLVPIVGNIVFLVFLCLEGTPGENRFGLDPKSSEPTR